MIFAEIQYNDHYDEFHEHFLKYLKTHFAKVDAGLQSDFWIWIYEGERMVKVDTFSSMRHQKVIAVQQKKYKVVVYDEPLLVGHEE
jgi:hypothetical protein